METNSLTFKTLKNISYSFVGFVVPIAFSVFITPIIVHKLGVVEYGVLIFINTIMGFLGLLDLGLTSGVIKYISEYFTLKQYERLQNLLNTANGLFVIIGTINIVIFVIIGKFFLQIFNITSNQNLFYVFLFSGLTSFFTAANSVFTSIPNALQRFDIINKINLTQLFIYNIGALILALLGFQLKAILGLNLITLIGLSLIYISYCKKLLPQIKFGFAFNFLEIKKLYGFGIFSAIANFGMSAVNQFDRLLIPAFLGPTELTFYSLPGNIAQKTTTVVGSLGATFFPLANQFAVNGEAEKLGLIFRKVIRNLVVLAFACMLSIMLFGEKILYYWLGEEFAKNGINVLYILAVTYFLLSLFGIAFNFLMGLGKQKLVAIWSIIMAGVNLAFLLILLKPMGILGAGWAYLISVLPIIFLFYFLEKKVFLGKNIFNFYFNLGLKLIITAFIYYIIVGSVFWPLVKSFTSLVIIGPLAVISYLLIYWAMGFMDQEDIDLTKLFIVKIFEKFNFIKK